MYWTNYAEDKILRTFLGATVAAPTALYVALFISSPGETGAGTEVTYPLYARRPIAFTTPAADSTGVWITNTADISFAASSVAAGTVRHCGLMDSAVGGNMWAYVALDEPIEISEGVAPLIQAQEWRYHTSGNLTEAFKIKTLNLLRGINMEGFSPHVSLWNGDPDSGGAELAGSGYARFAVQFSAPAVQAAGQSMIANTALVSSPRAGDNWGTWSHSVIMDRRSGGTAVARDERVPAFVMRRGTAAFVEPGELSMSLH